MNNPFSYIPHPSVVAAAAEVRAYLLSHPEWNEELHHGKMFGVLIVRYPDGHVGFLAAYSGQIAGREDHDFFVPPVFDYLQENGVFKREERRIVAINQQFEHIAHSDALRMARRALDVSRRECDEKLARAKASYKASKEQRDGLRQASSGDDATLMGRLIAESQHQKADIRRLKSSLASIVAEKESAVHLIESQMTALDTERKHRSAVLQRWLFRNFRLTNGKGEVRSVWDIFSSAGRGVPPSGTGECCAPKLLCYALRNGLSPLHIGEFWVGDSPIGEVRNEGMFYGACQSKCAPLMQWMLKGIDVEKPLAFKTLDDDFSLTVLYEDECIIVVDKPSGLLSVPGLASDDSVEGRLSAIYPELPVRAVHRLDLSTSGILVLSKNETAYKAWQMAFANREVRKSYEAILDGVVNDDEGVIDLPLSADYVNRPRMRVDPKGGKRAVTRFKVLQRDEEQRRTLVRLYPLTGRTHQLRLHAAHPEGLGCPIEGDELYGKASESGLQLRAVELSWNNYHFRINGLKL